ncbi:MAG: GTP cyclohydrolase II [Alphaproteobacteria bacterium]|nr:GTP cyclohydrolase II [Alphaproteobacteria bacterium]
MGKCFARVKKQDYKHLMFIQHITQANLPTRFGAFVLHIFRDKRGVESMALVRGELRGGCLVRVHSECATGDIFGSLRCDCRDQLEASLQAIAAEGCGLLVYLRGHEGRGIGLANKIKAYALQEQGMDTVEANVHLGFPADARDYKTAAAVIRHFELHEIRLLTNNQDKIEALEKAGIHIAERIPLWTSTNEHNEDYVRTKRCAMGHLPGRSH